MKKFIALSLTLAMALSLAACTKPAEPATETPAETPAVETVATYKTGLGITVSPKTTDATADKDGSVQINTTLVVATFDAEGKVVSATIDVAQQKATVKADGTVNPEIDLRTKVEKGDDYGMRKVSEIGKEVNEQYAALADWFVGKTVEEIKAMPTFKRDDSHTAVPDVEDLKASVTISVESYVNALELAYANATETTGVPAKTGLGTVIGAKTADATADKEGSVQITTNIVAAAFDEAGKVVWAKIDAAQQKATFTTAGAFTGEIDLRTKVEKGDDYGMRKVSEIGKEVNEQYAALADWYLGKTVAEIEAMPTFKRDDNHTAVPDIEDLKASVTITVGDYTAALVKAEANAK